MQLVDYLDLTCFQPFAGSIQYEGEAALGANQMC